MTAQISTVDDQVVLAEQGRPVVQYNARTVELPDGYYETLQENNRQYAKPRSGYIHPLYGPEGEELTLDWSVDHPHHRGIYWAWPEVQYKGQIGDLHALQHVYSRSVGDPKLTSTDTFAQVEAQNLWLWEDDDPIVFEKVIVTAHMVGQDGSRAVDIELHFKALADGVTLARRGTNLYGGLNTRLAPVSDLKFERHADAPDATPQRAWSLASGTWQGGTQPLTLAILEHPDNPDYPGDWITYEYLPWFQPAFPRAGTRFLLNTEKALILRYRYLIIPGQTTAESLIDAFDTFVESTTIKPAQNIEKEG